MLVKFAVTAALAFAGTAAVAEARSDVHLYGAVPVAGDPHLMANYDSAQAWCKVELYGTYHAQPMNRGAFGTAPMRNCLARYGFVYQGNEPYAYPVRNVVFIVK